MNYIEITYPEPLELNKEDLIKFQLRYILRDMDLNETDLSILALVHLYGRDAIYKAAEAGIVKREKSAENIISSFRRKGIIHGTGGNTQLHPEMYIVVDNIKFIIKAQLKNAELDNELQQVQ